MFTYLYKLTLSFLLLSCSVSAASAAVIWDWSFPDNNIQVFPDEEIYLSGTITNDITSSEVLTFNSVVFYTSGGDLNNSDMNGIVYSQSYSSNLTGGIFPNGQSISIAPGDSYDFNTWYFTPITSVPVGTSMSLTLEISPYMGDDITNTLNATVVPLPPSALLLLSGFLPLIVVKRFKAIHNIPGSSKS